MGGVSSSMMGPQELVEFRKSDVPVDDIEIPAPAKYRKLTDRKGFVLLGIGILITLSFVIYALTNADFRRFTNYAYDNCGNLCGETNDFIASIPCSGQNYTYKPYSFEDKCVDRCPSGEYEPYFGLCIHQQPRTLTLERYPRSLNNEKVTVPLSSNAWWKIVISILITIGLSVLTLVALRYAPAVVVWGIIGLSVLALLGGIVAVWYLYFSVHKEIDNGVILLLDVIWTIFSVFWLMVIAVLFKRIGLVIQLYKETTKVLAAMPLLIFVPVITTLINIGFWVAFVVIHIYLQTSRALEKITEETYFYRMNAAVVIAIFFNFFVFAWIWRIVSGIQYMIISGSVASWYFAKNKQFLDSPIARSVKITLRYHVGTIIFGSLLMNLFAIVKAIIRAFCRNACCRCLVLMCCECLEVILKFLSESSYIETAIHGQSYLRSAKRATKLLLTNAKNLIAVTCVGDFILVMIVLVLAVVSTLISSTFFQIILTNGYIEGFITFIINILIISITFGVFQTTIETLFICFCEDTSINDGISKPYFMSKGLMEFVENSKKVYAIKN